MLSQSRVARGVAVAVALLLGGLTLVTDTPTARAETLGLDAGFAGGKVIVDIGPIDRGGAVAVQTDGSVVVGGGARRPNGYTDMVVNRFRPDGRPDPTFGVAGQVLLPRLGQPTVDGLVIQPDGRILVTAIAQTVRLLADGQVDPSWGAGRTVAGGVALVVQPDGRVVVAGKDEANVYVARYHPDGSPDPSFGTGGRMVGRFFPSYPWGGYDVVRALLLQSDGSVVVVGFTGFGTMGYDPTDRFALLRLTPSGRPDPTFGVDGRVITSPDAGTTRRGGLLYDGVLQADGNIVVAGAAYTMGPTGGGRAALARYRVDGSLDPTFGTGGLVVTVAPPAVDPGGGQVSGGGSANSVTLDAAGRAVVAGAIAGTGNADMSVGRFTTGGAVDTTFDGDGWMGQDISGDYDVGEAVAIQADGRIVVVGTADGYRAGDVFVARFVDGEPAGRLESMTVAADTHIATVSGWAADGDASSPVSVRIQVDGTARSTVVADQPRPDLARPDGHGFATTLPLGGGNHSVCAHVVNQGAGVDTLIGCRSVVVASDPFGSLDTVGRRPGGVLVDGWAIDPDTAGPVAVYVYVDGVFRQSLAANRLRPDVGGAYPGTGDSHGFQGVVAVGAGSHNVCAFALNQGAGANQLLGCKNVGVAFDPIGSLEVAMSMGQAGTAVRGWAIDPDVAGPVTVYVYVDGPYLGSTPANQARLDVEAVVKGYGPNHGFEAFFPGTSTGMRTICAFAINQAAGVNSLLGCIRG